MEKNHEKKRIAPFSPEADTPSESVKSEKTVAAEERDKQKKGATSPRALITAGIFLLVLFFGGVVLWAYFAQITNTVIAPGQVKISSNRKLVQHFEGGIVSDVLVTNGAVVHAGDPLVLMESTPVSSLLQLMRVQQYALLLAKARLEAEKKLEEVVVWPQDFVDGNATSGSTSVDTLLESEQKYFTTHRESLDAGRALLQNQVEQIFELLDALKERIILKQSIASLLQKEKEAKEALYKKRFLDKGIVLKLQREVHQVRASIESLTATRDEYTLKIEELNIQKKALVDEYVQKAATDLAAVNEQILDLKERLNPILDVQQRLVVRAPVTGEVMALQVHSVGEVLAPGAVILEIVPSDAPLVLECHIQPADIAQIHTGLSTDVQLGAFDTRTTPRIPAKLTYISPDRTEQKTAYGTQAYYKAHVVLEKRDLQQAGVYISAGMSAVAFINVEPRTVLHSFLRPLQRDIDRALREN